MLQEIDNKCQRQNCQPIGSYIHCITIGELALCIGAISKNYTASNGWRVLAEAIISTICQATQLATSYQLLSENRGYPQIAILMGNMVIIHWNMRYTIFRQTRIMYTQHTMLSILAAAHGGAGHGLEPSRPGSESVQRRAGWCIARSGSITNHHILQL